MGIRFHGSVAMELDIIEDGEGRRNEMLSGAEVQYFNNTRMRCMTGSNADKQKVPSTVTAYICFAAPLRIKMPERLQCGV